ncbi:MAG: hypothetical protein HYU29_06540 [Chloroflexi bacterium]|nr:hypothetical protein [Chloroflexota bacterium]
MRFESPLARQFAQALPEGVVVDRPWLIPIHRGGDAHRQADPSFAKLKTLPGIEYRQTPGLGL